MKILHISEAYGGGVTSAINTYVTNSPQFEHYLFATPREKDSTGEEGVSVFKSTFFVKRNFKAIVELHNLVKALNPDVIHVHSTYAGVICRLLPFIPKAKSIYTPHGFAFLRNDHPILLKAFYLTEKLLSLRSSIIAGCGRDESNIAESFIGKNRVFELVNVCESLPEVSAVVPPVSLPVVGMIGRISNQKGFDFFIKTSNALKGKAHFKWIGGGEFEQELLLRQASIEVTGWVDRGDVISHLKGLDLYFHTAAWEGFPISVLEASKLHKPILLRAIAPFKAENLPTVESVEDASRLIELWLEGEKSTVELLTSVANAVNEYHNLERLRQSLNMLYLQFKRDENN